MTPKFKPNISPIIKLKNNKYCALSDLEPPLKSQKRPRIFTFGENEIEVICIETWKTHFYWMIKEFKFDSMYIYEVITKD